MGYEHMAGSDLGPRALSSSAQQGQAQSLASGKDHGSPGEPRASGLALLRSGPLWKG